MSREERLQKSENSGRDFWWLSDGAPSPAESLSGPDLRDTSPEIPEKHWTGQEKTESKLTMENMERYKYMQELREKVKH